MKYYQSSLLTTILICLLFYSCADFPDKTASSPNIIIILTDDLGYADVGFNGCKDIFTPNIDKLATNGVKFTDAYVSYAVCGPSRAGLITGRYQDRFGFGRNPLFTPKDPMQGLPLSEETLATTLSRVGYKSMAIGKWHLGAHTTLRPLKRGFDEFFGFLTGGHQYFPSAWTLQDETEVKTQYGAYKTKLLKNETRVEETEYLTDALSREAVAFIERNSKQAFFLYLAYNAPHGPLQATEKYLDRYNYMADGKRKTYAAMISAVDDGVGHILDKLKELAIEERTMVFFLSDNGGLIRNSSDNTPLRGQKGDYFEGGIRVPFAMQWKGQVPAGTVYDKPIISLDIFATAAKYANAKSKNKLDGVNIIPFVRGTKKGLPHQQLFWRNFDKQTRAIRKGNDKMISFPDSLLLFDLQQDISETNNLADQKDKTLIKLHKSFRNWEENMKEPVFLGLMQNDEYNRLHPDRFGNKIKESE